MKYNTILLMVFTLGACKNSDHLVGVDLRDPEWLIDTEYVRQGCFSGRDCIPSLQKPDRSVIDGDDLNFLNDDDLVVGVWNGSDYVAYPHPVLDWHEIVNEDGYSISYCPLTGSAVHISTDVEFGVSGLLYNSNLIMYDRETKSYWPQMYLKSAAGNRSSEPLKLKPVLETTWGNWKKLFPQSEVVNSNTGFNRNYNRYPYGVYKSCNTSNCGDYIYFPVANLDGRLPAKERVLTIITDDKVTAYPISLFSTPTVLRNSSAGRTFTVVISGADNIAIAFETSANLSITTWEMESSVIILEDDTGSKWNILGVSIDGHSPELPAAPGYIAYWFSVGAYYPQTEIYE